MYVGLVAAAFLIVDTGWAIDMETMQAFVSPNSFEGSDVERINEAIRVAAEKGLARGGASTESRRASEDLWLLDSAILVRDNTTLVLDNCHIKLSDRCRDNMIRSANCGLGITDIRPMKHVHICGVGHVLLEGADHPRATGDSAKTLGQRTYGTDAGKEGESQTGDWRNIGILLAFGRALQHREPPHQGLPLLGDLRWSGAASDGCATSTSRPRATR